MLIVADLTIFCVSLLTQLIVKSPKANVARNQIWLKGNHVQIKISFWTSEYDRKDDTKLKRNYNEHPAPQEFKF